MELKHALRYEVFFVCSITTTTLRFHPEIYDSCFSIIFVFQMNV